MTLLVYILKYKHYPIGKRLYIKEKEETHKLVTVLFIFSRKPFTVQGQDGVPTITAQSLDTTLDDSLKENLSISCASQTAANCKYKRTLKIER